MPTPAQEAKLRKEEEVPTSISIEKGTDSAEVLAEEISRLADAADGLQNCSLTERAILVLLQDRTGLPKGTIRLVLDALPELRTYIK